MMKVMNDEEVKEKVKQLVQDGENISFYDHRFRDLFESLKNSVQRLSNDGHASKGKQKKSTEKYDNQEIRLVLV